MSDQRERDLRSLWGSEGAYERLAERFDAISAALVEELDLAGRRVLDAATGTGNTALHAARAGADVDAFDLVPKLLEVARERAATQQLTVRFRQGDLIEIPYPDGTFDVVLSTFGALAADDPRRCASQLVRVCRPGGLVVSTAWTADSSLATPVRVALEQYPQLQNPMRPTPWAWADEAQVAVLFDGLDIDLELEQRRWWFRYPSTTWAFDFLEEVSGPFQRLRAGVEATGGEWAVVRDEAIARWDAVARRADGGGIELPDPYGVLWVRRRAA